MTICQDLQDHVEAMGAGERAVLIENVMGGDVEEPPTMSAASVRREWSIDPSAPLVLYTGTFEAYQGSGHAPRRDRLIWRGHGRPCVFSSSVDGRSRWKPRVHTPAPAGAPAIFTGHQPAREIPAFVEAADILASPRIAGTNTPLKIYSYLRAGKPIVATDLLTHTQVLDRETALLVAPEPAAFAAALERLLADPAEPAQLARAAGERARTRYSREAYVSRTRLVCDRLTAAGLRTRVRAVPHA